MNYRNKLKRQLESNIQSLMVENVSII